MKVLRTQKKIINNNSTRIAIDQLVLFLLSPQSYENALLKSKTFTWHRKSFLKDLLRQGKNENKRGEVWLLYLPWLHYVGLKFSFAHEKQEKICLCHVLLTVIIFPKNIQSVFSLTLFLKRYEITIAVLDYIRQYQLNFS